MSDRRTVWIVDDVELELEASRHALDPKYAVETFLDGGTVLERAASGSLPDVLVLDWHMDGIAGLDVLRYLRAQPATTGLPILVFTATGDRDDLLDALAAGADDYVGKGASNEELNARVHTLVRGKSLRERAERAEAELALQLVRERAARAEAESANRAKDLFLATVSHELRNPLSAILGWARLLQSGALDGDRAGRAIDTIERNAVAQARIIDDLFDVARIVSGNLRLELVPLELNVAIEQAVETLRPQAAAREIELRTTLAPCTVSGDTARLQQVALNLLSNAVKFTPAGGRIVVELRATPTHAILTVRDTGPGFPPGLLPHVFERFRQGDPSITRSHGGLGLGLAIVREVVVLHGGTVEARNESAGGATVEITLPTLFPDLPDPLELGPGRPRPGAELAGRLVLVVDDEPDARALLCTVLSTRGATVLEASSADEALAHLAGAAPDVILSDLAMPERDGYWFMREVRRRHGSAIPAVAVTAHVGRKDRAAAAAAGYQGHVPKPLDTEALVLAITGMLAGSSPR